MQQVVKIKRLKDGAQLPSYQSAESAGADLAACLDSPVEIAPQTWALIPTGIALELPAGFEAQVRPRSGLALRKGITLLNSPGTIDSDYRGEVQVILINHSTEVFTVRDGERIAQLVISRYTSAIFTEDEELAASERGSGGFGSTGV